MKLYQFIVIDDYNIIVSKVKNYLEKKELINTEYAGYIPLNKNELINSCPELVRSLLKFDLFIDGAAIYRTTNNTQSPVHIDHVTYKCRVNIPIMNCEYSSTVFYNADIENTLVQPWDDTKYIKCINAVEIDRVTIDRPMILRINTPHRVEMDTSKSPRICLTIRCSPDPVMLFTKE
jgi:hypothetical protein